MATLKVIRGTELKLVLDSLTEENVEDIDLSSSFVKVEAYTNTKNRVTVNKKNCTLSDDGTYYYIPIDTSTMEAGNLIIDVYLNITDAVFDDGKRTEIYRKYTNIKIVV